jgi:hypothetical protein
MSDLPKVRSIFKDLLNRNIVPIADVEEFLFDPLKFEAAVQDVKSRLTVKLKTGVCSHVLISQIARHYCGLGEEFGERIEFYHGSEICDTIERIDRGILNGKRFEKSRMLIGLYKAHHSELGQKHSIAYNILNGLNKNTIKAAKQRGANSISDLLSRVHSQVLSKKKQSGDLTGEWIVYAQVDSVNYYLCLATHKEGRGDGNTIYQRIKPCLDEFPALAELRK